MIFSDKKGLIFLFILCLTGSLYSQSKSDFDHFFEDKTLRLDLMHTGTKGQDQFSEDEMFQEPVWPGSIDNLVDTLNLGKYFLTVYDLRTNQLIYSYGFCSIFGEWQTTDEAKKGKWRSFSESIRFPWPKSPVKITIEARDTWNVFRPVWTTTVDPSDHGIIKNPFDSQYKTIDLLNNGHPHQTLDLLILPDGYTSNEMNKFIKDSKRLTDQLFSMSPFKERKKDWNVRLIETPSNESGIDNPNLDVYRDNRFSCSFNSLNSDRYVLSLDNKTIRKIASQVPYDQIILLVNEAKYGGGGIYNLYATCTSDNPWSGYVFVHEFGHAFGGLGDEYYTSDVSYTEFFTPGVDPWEPNIAVVTESGKVKWQSFMEPGTPIPTDWGKEHFDQHASDYQKIKKRMTEEKKSQFRMDSLIQVNDKWVSDYLRNQKYWGKVGAFEGSGYVSNGLYRPFIDCCMFSRNLTATPFDPVCKKAIEKVMDFYTR